MGISKFIKRRVRNTPVTLSGLTSFPVIDKEIKPDFDATIDNLPSEEIGLFSVNPSKTESKEISQRTLRVFQDIANQVTNITHVRTIDELEHLVDVPRNGKTLFLRNRRSKRVLGKANIQERIVAVVPKLLGSDNFGIQLDAFRLIANRRNGLQTNPENIEACKQIFLRAYQFGTNSNMQQVILQLHNFDEEFIDFAVTSIDRPLRDEIADSYLYELVDMVKPKIGMKILNYLLNNSQTVNIMKSLIKITTLPQANQVEFLLGLNINDISFIAYRYPEMLRSLDPANQDQLEQKLLAVYREKKELVGENNTALLEKDLSPYYPELRLRLALELSKTDATFLSSYSLSILKDLESPNTGEYLDSIFNLLLINSDVYEFWSAINNCAEKLTPELKSRLINNLEATQKREHASIALEIFIKSELQFIADHAEQAIRVLEADLASSEITYYQYPRQLAIALTKTIVSSGGEMALKAIQNIPTLSGENLIFALSQIEEFIPELLSDDGTELSQRTIEATVTALSLANDELKQKHYEFVSNYYREYLQNGGIPTSNILLFDKELFLAHADKIDTYLADYFEKNDSDIYAMKTISKYFSSLPTEMHERYKYLFHDQLSEFLQLGSDEMLMGLYILANLDIDDQLKHKKEIIDLYNNREKDFSLQNTSYLDDILLTLAPELYIEHAINKTYLDSHIWNKFGSFTDQQKVQALRGIISKLDANSSLWFIEDKIPLLTDEAQFPIIEMLYAKAMENFDEVEMTADQYYSLTLRLLSENTAENKHEFCEYLLNTYGPNMTLSVLHNRSADAVEPTKLGKTGSQTWLLPEGKHSIRVLEPEAMKSWVIAMNPGAWKDAGFDYIPIEPILKIEQLSDGKVGITTQNLNGWAINTCGVLMASYPTEIIEAVNKKVELIWDTIESLGIYHGHPHSGNLVLTPATKTNEAGEIEIDVSVEPQIFAIDFDRAIYFPEKHALIQSQQLNNSHFVLAS